LGDIVVVVVVEYDGKIMTLMKKKPKEKKVSE